MNNILDVVREAEEMFSKYEITGNEQARAKKLREKLEDDHMTVSVIGQFKRGKSAMVNRILGDNILPMGIVPVTAVVTTVDYGPKSCEVRFENGVIKSIGFDEIESFVNEQVNQDNHLNVTKVLIHAESEFLKNGLTFVDTPGVGSLHEKNSEEAYNFVKESDAVIFMLSVDSPINQIEVDFLKNAKEYAAKFYFAVNKIDAIEREDLDAYIDYCRMYIAKIMEVDSVNLFPVSAKTGEGVEELKEAIEKDCQGEFKRILAESSEKKLHDIVVSALSQITSYRNTLQMTLKEFDQAFIDLENYFKELHLETASLPEALRNNKAVCEAHTNDVKNRLARKVKELFNIEYHYEIEDILEEKAEAADGDLVSEVDAICTNLDETLNKIFMHREWNTYVVAHRINDLNRLVRRLVQLRSAE